MDLRGESNEGATPPHGCACMQTPHRALQDDAPRLCCNTARPHARMPARRYNSGRTRARRGGLRHLVMPPAPAKPTGETACCDASA